MKAWQAIITPIALFAVVLIVSKSIPEQTQEAPEEIEIYRYYNEDSNVECFYHQNAISCLWAMDGGK